MTQKTLSPGHLGIYLTLGEDNENSIDGVTVWAVYISPGPFPCLIIGQDGELDVSRFVSCEILHRQPTFVA